MRRPSAKAGPWADHYTQQAKKDRYPARSVYKLKEIQSRHRLMGKGDKILDLGCFPGSWLLYASDLVGSGGQVVGIDLKPVAIGLPPNTRVMTGDILALGEDTRSALGSDFTGVLSDMAPATTGNKHVDSARSYNLCEAALMLALDLLAPGGFFVCKVFQGAAFAEFTTAVRGRFQEQRLFKPKSSRKASKEIYVIGKNKQS